MSESSVLEAAVRCHRDGQLRDAETLYGEFLEDHPEHPDALHLRGVALYQLDDPINAEPLIRKAIILSAVRLVAQHLKVNPRSTIENDF